MDVYFLRCPHQEVYEPEHAYIYTLKCRRCGKTGTVTLKAQNLFNFHHGAHIQSAFPYLSAGMREWMLSGLCEECFDFLYAPPPEEPDEPDHA